MGQAKSKQLWLKSQKDNVSLMFLNENNRGIESTNRKCGQIFIIDKVYFFQFEEFFASAFLYLTECLFLLKEENLPSAKARDHLPSNA